MAKHISEQYDLELLQIRERLMEMGGIVEAQVSNACSALINHNLEMAAEVRDVVDEPGRVAFQDVAALSGTEEHEQHDQYD